jgi:SAM-dependent methyltransferase
LFRARDYVSGEEFGLVRCTACGLVRTRPAPAPGTWHRYYPPAYYGRPGANRFPPLVERLQDALYAARARRVERLCGGRPGRVLDIGCGRGHLLRQFQRRGWDVLGTELGAAAAAHARDVLGVPVESGDVRELGLPGEHFDAVVLWHVIEHAADPSALLAEASRLLRPGGIALVAAPNFASPEARLTGDRWFHLDVPRHLSHFTPVTLARALGDAGLEPERWSGFAPEYDLFGFVQSALNRIGLPHNLLYDALRGRSAKLLGRDGAAVPLAVAAALPAALLALPWIAIAGATGRGATLTVFARRPAGGGRGGSSPAAQEVR